MHKIANNKMAIFMQSTHTDIRNNRWLSGGHNILHIEHMWEPRTARTVTPTIFTGKNQRGTMFMTLITWFYVSFFILFMSSRKFLCSLFMLFPFIVEFERYFLWSSLKLINLCPSWHDVHSSSISLYSSHTHFSSHLYS